MSLESVESVSPYMHGSEACSEIGVTLVFVVLRRGGVTGISNCGVVGLQLLSAAEVVVRVMLI